MNHNTLTQLVEHARQLAQLDTCRDHDQQAPTACSACRADALAAHDNDTLRRLDQVRAMATCDRLFPRRYRDALPDESRVAAWTRRVDTNDHTSPSLLLLGLVGPDRRRHIRAA
jgi:hypothetical protein